MKRMPIQLTTATAALAVLCGGCLDHLLGEPTWRVRGTAEVPVAIQQQFSREQPGRMYFATKGTPGVGQVYRLADVLCDPMSTNSMVEVGDGGVGCAQEHRYVVWIEPIAASELALTPCGTNRSVFQITGLVPHPERAVAHALATTFEQPVECEASGTFHFLLMPGPIPGVPAVQP